MSTCKHKTPFSARDTAHRFADYLSEQTGRPHSVRTCRRCKALIVGPVPSRDRMHKLARDARAQ